jgi:hypothetical protein
MTVGLVGRNLLNVTNCPCPDAESAFDFVARGGSTVRGYPSTRSLTAEVGVTF